MSSTSALPSADTKLPPDVVPLRTSRPAAGDAVLLTGATGFLGRHLLTELLTGHTGTVFCLVRGTDDAHARRRLAAVLAAERVPETVAARALAVAGSVAKPRLGLAESPYRELASRIGAVYHCAAWVNLVVDYAFLRGSNVLGTVEVLRLACAAGGVPVHYVSTLGVLMDRFRRGTGPVGEGDPLPPPSGVGYQQSKWAAEVLAAQAVARGVPVTVYRPGVILGHSVTGRSGSDDWFMRLTRASVRAGCSPDHPFMLPLASVDQTARMVTALASGDRPGGEVFHVVRREPLALGAYFAAVAALGRELPCVPVTDWADAVAGLPGQDPATAELARRLPVILPAARGGPVWADTHGTYAALGGFSEHPLDHAYFRRLIDACTTIPEEVR